MKKEKKAVNSKALKTVIEPNGKNLQYWKDIWRYRSLAFNLAKRDITVRYKQTVIGLGGQITVESRDGDTVFSGFVPRKRLKLSEGHQECEENSKKNDEIIK